jgi:hypothetical protein
MGYSFRYSIPPNDEALKRRRVAQMSMVGNFLSFWTNTELCIEMVIRRELGLTLEQTCVICAPLGGGAKTELLVGLFKDHPTLKDFVAAVKAFQSHVSRNWLAHGFIIFDDWNAPWDIVFREAKNGLKVKRRRLVDWFSDEFEPAFDRVIQTSGFTDQQIHDYGIEIRALAKAPQSQARLPLGDRSNSTPSTPE